MNHYSHLLYKRGFLFTNKHLEFNDKLTKKVIDNWNRIDFADYKIYFDKSASLSYAEEGNYKVSIIGLVLNPFEQTNNIREICEKLLYKIQQSEGGFLDYLDELSGRFVIFAHSPKGTEIFNDACGTLTVFYDITSEDTVVSSHATIVAEMLSHKPSRLANQLLKDKNFKGRRYLPGLLSPYDGIKPLTPNTKLIVDEKKIERFFPRESLNNTASYSDLLNEVSTILKSQSKLLSENNKVSISITAGLDSRLTYAAQREVKGDVDYFTHISSNNEDPYLEDVDIATKLTNIKGDKYTIYKYSAESHPDNFEDFREVWLKNVGMMRGSVHLFKMYTDVFPKNRVHIRSNVAEIARVFYSYRSQHLNAKKLARYFTRSEVGKYPEVIESFQDFIDTTQFNNKNMYNYEYQDIFYWEHRMPMWHSWILNESDPAYETFVPFNNRLLLKKMLTAPFEKRKTGELFTDLIEIMWPELLNYPVNKEFL